MEFLRFVDRVSVVREQQYIGHGFGVLRGVGQGNQIVFGVLKCHLVCLFVWNFAMQSEFATNLAFCISFEGSDPSKLNAICDRIFGVHNLSTTCAYANYGALTDEIWARVR